MPHSQRDVILSHKKPAYAMPKPAARIRQQHLQHTDISKSRDAWVYLVQQQQVIANIRGVQPQHQQRRVHQQQVPTAALKHQCSKRKVCSVAASRWTSRGEVVTSALVSHLFGCSVQPQRYQSLRYHGVSASFNDTFYIMFRLTYEFLLSLGIALS
jgi:hypothetical protein